MKKLLFLVVLLLGSVFLCTPAQAVLIWGTDASGELTGSRTSDSGGGVVATEDWANGGFSISWEISQSDGVWTYTYSFELDRKGLSHFILEVTEDGPFQILPGSYEPIEGPDLWELAPGNPFMPNPIYGIKFDDTDGTELDLIIVTDRAPVYGVFYAKDGKTDGNDVVAWSTALEYANYDEIETLTTTDYIVRPDSAPIPEPATMLLLGTGLIGMALIGRTKFRKVNKKS